MTKNEILMKLIDTNYMGDDLQVMCRYDNGDRIVTYGITDAAVLRGDHDFEIVLQLTKIHDGREP